MAGSLQRPELGRGDGSSPNWVLWRWRDLIEVVVEGEVENVEPLNLGREGVQTILPNKGDAEIARELA